MSEEQQQLSSNPDNLTPITRTWRLGGPMSAAQRKEAKRLFLEYLKSDPNVSAACDLACISRDTAYRWRDQDSKFADGWESALERLHNKARSSIYQRGIIGWDEPVVSMGQLVYEMVPVVDENNDQVYEKSKPKMRRGKPITLHKWSDSLAALYAKANLPEYKEKQTIDFHLQMSEEAEKAKNEVLADLASAIANEDQNQTHQE